MANNPDLVKELEFWMAAFGRKGIAEFVVDGDNAKDLFSTLQRAREALELRRLEMRVVRALVRKLTVNTYGTDKQCKEAFKELWTAFDELEVYENDKRGNIRPATLDNGRDANL